MKLKGTHLLKYLPLLLAIGLGAGFVNGLLGAGGGIIVVIGLRLLFGKKVADGRSFYATAIAVMLPLSAVSAWQYIRVGHLTVAALGPLLLPALLGGVLGALLLRLLKPKLLGQIFAAVVLISGIVLVV